MLEPNGLIVPMLLVTSEINQTVDLAGPMELLKLSMIEPALKMESNTYYQLLILLDVVDFYLVSQWDATEDK